MTLKTLICAIARRDSDFVRINHLQSGVSGVCARSIGTVPIVFGHVIARAKLAAIFLLIFSVPAFAVWGEA